MRLNLQYLLSIFLCSPVVFSSASSAVAQTAGCGSGWSNTALKVLTPIASNQFRVACNEHDACYDTFGKAKQECDKAFHNRMLGICARDHNTILGRPLKIACNGRADGYYNGVRQGAQDAYDKAQAAATSDAQQKIIGFYRDFLSREPRPDEIDFRMDSFRKGYPLERQRTDLAFSEEVRQKIVGFFRQYLGRDPDSDGIKSRMNALLNGRTLEQQRVDIQTSPEARSRQ
jgi:hypothetical protein